MSRDRISKKSGWASTSLPRGPNGRCLCRWCNVEVPKGRRTFCSDPCVHEHKIRSNPRYVREQLFRRDVGVCAICRADTEALRHQLRKAIWGDGEVGHYPRAAQEAYARLQGETYEARQHRVATALQIPERFVGLELSRSWWDADHIVPVVEGGGECGLDGYRSLCVPCHRDVTRELRGRLAANRKQARKAAQEGHGEAPTAKPTPGDPRRPTRTPVPAQAGLRHNGVPEVRRPGPDAPVQGRVSAVPDPGGDV